MQKEDFERLVEQARQANLLEYFKSSGYTLQKKGKDYYVKEVVGLCISSEGNRWFHHYSGIGRTNNAVDCLKLVLGKDFNQAVYELTGQDVTKKRSTDFETKYAPKYTSPPSEKMEKAAKNLMMPEQAPNMRRLYAYFCQTRKIPSEIVQELCHAKLLYQSDSVVNTVINGQNQTFQNANAVFVHRDAEGKAVGGEIQGLNSYKRYKGMVTGTGETGFQFVPVPIPNQKPKRAYIFESAIDLMSFYSFCDKQKLAGTMLVSMAGLKPSIPKKLAEEGLYIISCVDNDDAGRRFEQENGYFRSESVKRYLDENGFKDWNELLVYHTAHSEVDVLHKSERQTKGRTI